MVEDLPVAMVLVVLIDRVLRDADLVGVLRIARRDVTDEDLLLVVTDGIALVVEDGEFLRPRDVALLVGGDAARE
jgi:hypothetical protein